MAQMRVNELDFEQIKNNLKIFLKSQEEFSDYNFEGSGMAVLIDLLAYNTHYNGMLAHMLANENFIDTAIKRESVVSIAKALGYTPRSYLSSEAKITLTVTSDPAFVGTNLTLDRDVSFTTQMDGASYTFFPQEDVTVAAEIIDGVKKFVFTDLKIKEGSRVVNRFTVSQGKPQGPYVIPNENADVSTLRVRIQESLSDITITTWNKVDTMLDVKGDSRVYWVEEGIDGLNQLRFGDGVLGQKLKTDNIIIIDYLAGKGVTPNGAKTFNCTGVLTGGAESFSITTGSVASGGSYAETVDEIRFNAPRFNATRDRAVTEQDYKSLILQSNPNIQSVSVWGGEKNDPPMYGKVFISLNPVAGQIITEQDKDTIKNTIIDPKTPVAIIPEFVDPEFTYIQLEVTSVYNPKETVLTKGQVEAAILIEIENYFNNSLNRLNKSFYYSRLHDRIKEGVSSLISTNIQLGLQKRIKPDLNKDYNYTLMFNQKLQPRELTSTFFDVTIAGTTQKAILQDVPNSDVKAPSYNGSGVINAITPTGDYLGQVGTIDYDSGKISIPKMYVTKLYGTETVLRVTVKPHDSVKDITTQALVRTSDTSTAAVVAKPSRNTVLTKDDSVLNSAINTISGVRITATKEVEEV